jgi:hypothetical protein
MEMQRDELAKQTETLTRDLTTERETRINLQGENEVSKQMVDELTRLNEEKREQLVLATHQLTNAKDQLRDTENQLFTITEQLQQ